MAIPGTRFKLRLVEILYNDPPEMRTPSLIGPSYIERVRNEDTSFNLDTPVCPKGVWNTVPEKVSDLL